MGLEIQDNNYAEVHGKEKRNLNNRNRTLPGSFGFGIILHLNEEE